VNDQVPAEFAAYSLAWAEEFDGPAGAAAAPQTWRPETGGHGWGNCELRQSLLSFDTRSGSFRS
jgi:hypothetical protein